MRTTFGDVRQRGQSLWVQQALIFQELLRVFQILVPLAGIATAIALTYYIGENLAYTEAHRNNDGPYDARYVQLDDNAKWGYHIKKYQVYFDNSTNDIYNIDRASVILTAGLLCLVMNITVVALLIKRRLVPNILILTFDLILILFSLATFIYVRNIYQHERIPDSDLANAYYNTKANGQHWLRPSRSYDSISWLCALETPLDDPLWSHVRDLCNYGHRCYWLVLGIFIGEACVMPIHAWFWHREKKAPKEFEPEDKAEMIEDE